MDNKGNITYKDKLRRSLMGREKRESSDSSKIPVEEYNELAELITANKLFTCDLASCRKEYQKHPKILADSSSYVITIEEEGKEKSVSCYGELEEGHFGQYYYTHRHIHTTCPEEIAEIIILIEKLWGREIFKTGE